MATFSYEEHMKQQEARRSSSGSGQGPEVHFMGEFLPGDGDVAVVRFPYNSMADIKYTSTHLVMNYPGRKFGARVRCEGINCPICDSGIKVDDRVFVKALVYVVDNTGNVVIKNAVWDRAAAFADIDIKNLIDEYGSLRDKLLKIKKSGSGQSTRYSIMPIMNATVYNPEIYKADFTELDQVDAEKILSKSVAQYNAALNPNSETSKPVAKPVAPVQDTAPTTPAPAEDKAPWEDSAPQAAPATPSSTPAAQEVKRNRYQF